MTSFSSRILKIFALQPSRNFFKEPHIVLNTFKLLCGKELQLDLKQSNKHSINLYLIYLNIRRVREVDTTAGARVGWKINTI